MSQQDENRVAVFDINGTLYRKSSKEEFFKFVCFKNGYKLLDIYHVIIYKLLGKARVINQTQFKENFFNYLNKLEPDTVEQYAREYWSIEYPRYFNQELLKRCDELKRDGVKIICITGGLDVYVKPLFELFEADDFYGTNTIYKNGTYLIEGVACKGEEKLRRLNLHFGQAPYRIVEAYSDEEEPILDEAEKAFLVKSDGSIHPYHG